MIFLKKKKRKFLLSTPYEIVFGRKIFHGGKQFIIEAKTGETMELTQDIRYLGTDKNKRHYYLHKRNELLIGDKAFPSFQ